MLKNSLELKIQFILCAMFLCQTTYAADEARPCTSLACDSGMVLEVPAQYVWPHGSYLFEFVLDGKALTCRGDLPLKPCGESSIVCSGQAIQIGESGCALESKQHGWSAIRVDGFPKRIAVKISRNSRILISQTFEPQYIEVRAPCDQGSPSCKQGRAFLKPMVAPAKGKKARSS